MRTKYRETENHKKRNKKRKKDQHDTVNVFV